MEYLVEIAPSTIKIQTPYPGGAVGCNGYFSGMEI